MGEVTAQVEKKVDLKEKETREETRLGPGVAVRLFGLTGATELNGTVGNCAYRVAASGRWVVRFATGMSRSLKPENLQIIATGSYQAEPPSNVACERAAKAGPDNPNPI